MNKIEISKKRSMLYTDIRSFFQKKDYLEVFTPILTEALVPEHTIQTFATSFENEFSGNKNLYLIPSPEVYIKKLLSEGFPSLFEITKCFRNSEQLGVIHNPEFTMLEYYTLNYDENDSLNLTKEMLKFLNIDYPVLKMSVRDAVLKYSELDLDKLQDCNELRKAAEKLNLLVSVNDEWDDVFNMIFCTYVETALPANTLVFLTDYPRQVRCLAKRNGNYLRRWELYLNSIELANCFYEENEINLIKDYYLAEKSKIKPEKRIDENLINEMSLLPKCSGVAMGLDRLLMIKYGLKDIKEVLLFPYN